jgi:hypothetical protein
MHSPGEDPLMTAENTAITVNPAKMSAKSTFLYNFAGILPNFQVRFVTFVSL